MLCSLWAHDGSKLPMVFWYKVLSVSTSWHAMWATTAGCLLNPLVKEDFHRTWTCDTLPSYLISSVIKATQHPGNSVGQQGLDTWQSCSWSSGVSHLQEEVAVVLSLLPKVTVLKDSSPLLDAWLLGHTLGINQKTLGSPLDCKEIKPVNPKGNEPWIFTGRADAEAPILRPFDAKSWLTGKDPHAGKDWRQEKGGCREWDG